MGKLCLLTAPLMVTHGQLRGRSQSHKRKFPQSRASGRCAAVDRVTAADQDVWQERVVELLPFYVTWVGIQVQIVQVRLK